MAEQLCPSNAINSGWLIYIPVHRTERAAAGWGIRRELSICSLILNVYKSVLITVEGCSHIWVTIKGLHLRFLPNNLVLQPANKYNLMEKQQKKTVSEQYDLCMLS